MTDTTWLPNELWLNIANFLDNEDLARFRQICKATQFVGSHAVILQPLYNRLYALDKTLPALLPQDNAALAFKEAFLKIHTRQQEEIAYLQINAFGLSTKSQFPELFVQHGSVTLDSLEVKDAVLDKVNSEIITRRIDVNSTHLNLTDGIRLTRLPVSLFQREGYLNFWKNLTILRCTDNLTSNLNLQELVSLEKLYCCYTRLATLNVQGLSALRQLILDDRVLVDLNLTGVHADTKNEYAKLEQSLLWKQLEKANSIEEQQRIIARLGESFSFEDLDSFRQICKDTQFVGSHAMLLQPLYNRLYALDKTLPAFLPQDNAVFTFKVAFLKIHTRQQEEIAYLQKYHPELTFKPEYADVFAQNTSATLASLKAKDAVLDKINSEIIKANINVNSNILDLSYDHITRIPSALFQAEGYVNFWKNLEVLNCSSNLLTNLNVQGLVALRYLNCHNNNLTTLNVQGLVALNTLVCSYNQLTTLNVQGLVALRHLNCSLNQLTTLNAQGLVALGHLNCNRNQLTTLNVQGLVALRYLNCCLNQLTTLNVQGLVALIKLNCEHNKLTTLNVQGLVALSELYCSYNQLTTVNLQELPAIECLECHNNPLIDLNLTGVHADVKNKYAELEKSLLWKQLSAASSPEERQPLFARLGKDFTYKNCLYYAPILAGKTIASDVISKMTSYLPSFSCTSTAVEEMDEEFKNNKRARPEEEGDARPDEFKRMKKEG